MIECFKAMAAQGYAYAIVGGAGPKEFYKKTVGAVEIEDSTPGIYQGMLRK
jgi:nicotinamide mononucleotide (NMN) deamidase PncC